MDYKSSLLDYLLLRPISQCSLHFLSWLRLACGHHTSNDTFLGQGGPLKTLCSVAYQLVGKNMLHQWAIGLKAPPKDEPPRIPANKTSEHVVVICWESMSIESKVNYRVELLFWLQATTITCSIDQKPHLIHKLLVINCTRGFSNITRTTSFTWA